MQTMNQKRVNKDTTTRIPLPLQSIFLNANRGLVVDTPPPRNLAMKIFTRWKWRADIKLNESFGAKPTVQTDEDNPMICGVQEKKATKKRVSGLYKINICTILETSRIATTNTFLFAEIDHKITPFAARIPECYADVTQLLTYNSFYVVDSILQCAFRATTGKFRVVLHGSRTARES